MSLLEKIENASSVLISGHVRPDGDCAGSCLGLWNYIRANYPEKEAAVYLEPLPNNLKFLPGVSGILSVEQLPETADLFVSLDASTADRLGAAAKFLEKSRDSVVIDHHVTNTGFGKENVINGDASSACEVLYEQLREDGMTKEAAVCLYTGIIHDTGVFKYSATKERTMQIAGRLMSFGIDTAKLIDESFYEKTLLQTRLSAYAVSRAETALSGKLIYTVLSMEDMKRFEAVLSDTEGIIDQLRLVKGTEVAIFAREDAENTYKFSFRSKSLVNVADIAAEYGGGGHKFAAGVTLAGDLSELLHTFTERIQEALSEA